MADMPSNMLIPYDLALRLRGYLRRVPGRCEDCGNLMIGDDDRRIVRETLEYLDSKIDALVDRSTYIV